MKVTDEVAGITPEQLGIDDEPLQVGPLALWTAEFTPRAEGRVVPLTRREFQVLHVLPAAAGHVVARDRIRRHAYVPTTFEDWDIPDPAGKALEETRAIRDAIEIRVKDLPEQRIDLIRADRTAHQLRLARLLPMLVEEFAGQRSGAEVRLCADAVLTEFDDVPVRSHLMTIAHRKTRECLRRETCDVLAVA